jgi:predicted deacylase
MNTCFGGTHGNEYEGQVAVWRLMHELDPAQMCGRVILMPRLNTPACISGTRESQADGVNMNRAFPGDPGGTLTYRIAHFVTTRVFPLVDVVLDIHAAGRGVHFALCSSFHMVSDPQQYQEMKNVASLFDTPFVFIYSSEMARGLLTDQAEAMGKVTIGGEFGHSAGVLQQGVQHAYHGIQNVLRYYGMLPGDMVKVDPARGMPPRFDGIMPGDWMLTRPKRAQSSCVNLSQKSLELRFTLACRRPIRRTILNDKSIASRGTQSPRDTRLTRWFQR